jgi:hypothetical protein
MAVFLSLVLPSEAADDKKKDKKGDPAPTTDADKLPTGEFSGKLKNPPGSDGTFVVSVDYQHLELKNPNALAQFQKANPQLNNVIRDQQRIAQTQAKLANARTPQQQAQLLQQLQNEMNQLQTHQVQALLKPQQSPYVMKTETKDITFHAAEDVKVRFTSPPQAFDDKGNLKKYTPEELKELKGKDSKLPGYEGSVEKLASGMPVKFNTVTRKVPPKKDADKDKDKEAADKAPPESKTVVNMIIVQGDESSGSSNSSDKPKPKK